MTDTPDTNTEQFKPIVKRYNLSTEEKMAMQNFASVTGFLFLLSQGIRDSRDAKVFEISQRLGLKYTDAPEGYQRSINYDQDKFELVVTDIKIPEEVKKEEKTVTKPSN